LGLVREWDERLGLGGLIAKHLSDSRRGDNRQSPLADPFPQMVCRRLVGYEDVNDAERLSQSPSLPRAASGSRKTLSRSISPRKGAAHP
jgi:hypothetical protein